MGTSSSNRQRQAKFVLAPPAIWRSIVRLQPRSEHEYALEVIIRVLRTDLFTPTVHLYDETSMSKQLRYFVFPLILIAIAVAVSATDVSAKAPPNIVLVITDDQGYGPVGRHGHPWIQTPHLDELYDSSTRFTRFLVCPTCAPTRSALMTGRHPMRNGVTHTIYERERMTLDATTLPQLLQQAGYACGIFGKWHLGDECHYQPGQRGFDEVFIHGGGGIGQAYPCSCADAPDNTYFDPIVRYNGKFVRASGFCTDVFFSAALDWMAKERDNDRPFFAYIATNAPHFPFLAPEASRQRFEQLGFGKAQAGFYGMIENIDENMGRLMRMLSEWQLMDNTVVIFMSDNGMAGGGSGKPDLTMGTAPDGSPLLPYNAEMKGLKGTVDEGGVRVPLFVRWDGHWDSGRDIDHVTAHIDILPTLVELAGATSPSDQVEGRSLVPLLKDAKSPWDDRYLFTHQGRWKTGAEPNDFQWRNFAVRNAGFRLVHNTELYDMRTDPGQTRNVIDEHPKVVADMRAAYDRWWQETRPMMVNETAPMSKVRPFHVAYQEQLDNGGIPEWRPELVVE